MFGIDFDIFHPPFIFGVWSSHAHSVFLRLTNTNVSTTSLKHSKPSRDLRNIVHSNIQPFSFIRCDWKSLGIFFQKNISRWWFQPTWRIWVNFYHFPTSRLIYAMEIKPPTTETCSKIGIVWTPVSSIPHINRRDFGETIISTKTAHKIWRACNSAHKLW